LLCVKDCGLTVIDGRKARASCSGRKEANRALISLAFP